jgi:hypothetical protein
MDPSLVGLAVGGAVMLLMATGRLRIRVRAMRAAAEACGVERIRGLRTHGLVPSGITGYAGPLAVSLSPVSLVNLFASGTLVRVHQGMASIWVRPAGLDTSVQKRLLRAQEFEVGDPGFDEVAYVQGPPVLLRALLDHPTRLALRRLLAGTVDDSVSQRTFPTSATLRGELRFSFGEEDWLFIKEGLPLALRGILDLARRLVPPDDVAGRLAQNAREDPLDRVRVRNLEVLHQAYPRHEVTARALRQGCQDASEAVRLFAAIALGAEARDLVRRLAAEAEDDSCSARAIAALGAELPPAEALRLLRGALEDRRLATAEACVDRLGGQEGEESARSLTLVLEQEKGSLAVAAARALGAVGTVEAVLPLQEAGARAGGDLGQAARQAVAAIQSRLRGAERGQLTVATVEGGTVALASEGGQVSLPDPDGSLRE